MTQKPNYTSAFISMLLLFFMWGFITELDGALIPYLKGLFELSNFQAALVQFAFFIAFFIVSLPSAWILRKIGYQKGIVLGLLVMALGSWLFYPAASAQVYGVFLAAVFVLASGVTLLQVAANPYVSRLGDDEGASSRLNLAQGINSAAKVLAPLFGSYFILRGLEGLSKSEQATAVQMPYLILGGVLLAMAILFRFIKLPEVVDVESDERTTDRIEGDKTGAIQFPQLRWGIAAIFLYVGAEVTIATFLVIYMSEDVFPLLPEYQEMVSDLTSEKDKISRFREIGARYLPLYWGGLMVGRLLGSYLLKFISATRMLAFASVACVTLVLAFLFSSGLCSCMDAHCHRALLKHHVEQYLFAVYRGLG